MIDNDREFIFIHVPKSAGTSMDSVFRENGAVRVDNKVHNTLETYMAAKTKSTSYFSFMFVRNPWGRFVSSFLHRKRNKNREAYMKDLTFVEWARKVRSEEESFMYTQTHWSLYKDKPSVDFIGRYERLNEGWRYICSMIGIDSELPYKNKANHPYDYRNYYDNELYDIVSEYYKDDIENFNYTFDEG